MKRIFGHLPKRLIAAAATLVFVASLSATAFAAFGPDRPTRAWSVNENGFDHVTFNSFTGVPNGIGDERNFFRGVQVGRDSVWSDPVANVTQDAEVEAKIYIHNGADPALNSQPGEPGIAKNVKVRVALPTGEKQSQDMTAFISASNAQPETIFDTLTMTGANNGYFATEFVAGSGKLHMNGAATNLTVAQEQALIGGGMSLADIPGCFEYIREVTFRVKVKMPHYTLKKQVRFEGQTKDDWKENLDVKAGQVVEWKLEFDNIGRTQLHDVIILDQLPEGVTVVPGSVKLIDGNFPNGFVFDGSAIQNNGRQININIGNVNPGINSIIAFKTKVETKCSTNKLLNTAYATPKGFGSISDTASVTVQGEVCVTPEQPTPTPSELPKTGAGSVAGIVAATTIAGAIAHRFVYSRKYQG